ncbi:MAG: outer membrane lipoprotein chaperone LolA [Pseudomonadota bacterium]|nr:outer membrane lipoprotein chaperone LolA [Pseudomonadota bacterium]
MKFKHMIFFLLRILAILVFIAPVYASSQDVLANMIRGLATLEADYNQNIYGRKGKLLNSNNGHFMFKSPNLLRWQNYNNDKALTICDGSHIWQFEPDLDQVIKTSIKDAEQESSLLLFISDVAKLVKNNDVTTESQFAKTIKFKLVPKDKRLSNMTITFDKGFPTKIEYADKINNYTVINFSKVEKNESISEKWFTFVPQENIDIIEQ